MTDATDTNAQRIRELVNEIIRDHFVTGGPLNGWVNGSPYDNGGLTQKLIQEAPKRSLTVDAAFWSVMAEHIWTLARVGAIALLPLDPSFIGGSIQAPPDAKVTFRVTELGKRLFAEPDFSPFDWHRYEASTLALVGGTPDAVVLAHLQEAVLARQGTLYRSCVVMVGCAYERLVILLAQAVSDAKIEGSKKVREVLEQEPPVGVATLYKRVREALDKAALSSALADQVSTRMDGVFEYARGHRNRQGHPSGAAVLPEEADAALRLFPSFYRLVLDVIEAIKRLPPLGSG